MLSEIQGVFHNNERVYEVNINRYRSNLKIYTKIYYPKII